MRVQAIQKNQGIPGKRLYLAALIVVGFEDCKITILFSLGVFLRSYYFVSSYKGKIKVDFKVQFPFPKLLNGLLLKAVLGKS